MNRKNTPGINTDIIVCGGGLTGMVAAITLAQAGFKVALTDRRFHEAGEETAQRGDVRCLALAPASRHMLSALNLWDMLDETAQPIHEIKVRDGRVGERPSPFVMHFHHADLEHGPLAYMVRHDAVMRVCTDGAARQTRIQTLPPISSHTVTDARVTARLVDDRNVTGSMILVAEGGRNAFIRTGLRLLEHDYGQTALVTTIRHDCPHEGIAHQIFLPNGPLAILPLQGKHAAVVWTERRAEADRCATLPDDAFRDALALRMGNFLGDIALAGPRAAFPVRLAFAYSMIAPRVALAGDSAHRVHPLAGQGFNANLRDVAALGEVLVDARRRGEDFGSAPVLARYQRWRRFDNLMLAGGTSVCNALFSNDLGLLRHARALGVGALNASPAALRALASEAAGLTGRVPKLMQGQPL